MIEKSRGLRHGLHADRAAGGDRDHRRADRLAPARRPGGPRGGPPGPVRQQPQADRPRPPQLRGRPPGPARPATSRTSTPSATTPGRAGAGRRCSCRSSSRPPLFYVAQLRAWRSRTRPTSTGRLVDRQRLPLPVGPRSQPSWPAVDRDAPPGRRSAMICQVAPSNYVGMYGTGEPGPDGDGVFFRNSRVGAPRHHRRHLADPRRRRAVAPAGRGDLGRLGHRRDPVPDRRRQRPVGRPDRDQPRDGPGPRRRGGRARRPQRRRQPVLQPPLRPAASTSCSPTATSRSSRRR